MDETDNQNHYLESSLSEIMKGPDQDSTPIPASEQKLDAPTPEERYSYNTNYNVELPGSTDSSPSDASHSSYRDVRKLSTADLQLHVPTYRDSIHEEEDPQKSTPREFVLGVRTTCCNWFPFCYWRCCSCGRNSAPVAVIELKVKQLNQLFNTFDPSPFYEKDLDDDAERFLVSYAEDFEEGQSFEVHIILQREFEPEDFNILQDALKGHPKDLMTVEHLQTDIEQAFQNNFARRALDTRSKLKTLFRDGKTALLVGIIVLLVGLTLSNVIDSKFSDSSFKQVAVQSLVIFGWVAIWRPSEIFLYNWWPILREQRMYQRLSMMKISLRSSDGN